MERRAFLGTVGSATVAGLAGCIGQRATADHDVGMGAKEFRPVELRVAPGTTVTWRNTNKQGHSVTAYEDDIPGGADYFASGGFDGEQTARDAWSAGTDGTLFEGQTFEHTFEVPGTYRYFCIPHEVGGMIGTVVVTEDAATETA